MSHGTLPTMVVVRHGKPLVINVTDYNEETDTIPEPVAAVVSGATASTDSSDIPADWEKLAWPQMRALAARVAGRAIQGRADAVAVIQAASQG